jgi:peptide/nickel transport system permease protein
VALLSGSLAVEVVFSRPGLGRLAYDALAARDYPVLLAASTLAATAVVVAGLLTELLQSALDPRLRHAPS